MPAWRSPCDGTKTLQGTNRWTPKPATSDSNSIELPSQSACPKRSTSTTRCWKHRRRSVGIPRREDRTCGKCTLPSSRFPKLVALLARPNTSLLIQLHTGHVPLNHHLHRIGRTDTPRRLGCGAEKETVLHFILQCPEYALHRRVYFGPLGAMGSDSTYLLSTKEGTEQLF